MKKLNIENATMDELAYFTKNLNEKILNTPQTVETIYFTTEIILRDDDKQKLKQKYFAPRYPIASDMLDDLRRDLEKETTSPTIAEQTIEGPFANIEIINYYYLEVALPILWGTPIYINYELHSGEKERLEIRVLYYLEPTIRLYIDRVSDVDINWVMGIELLYKNHNIMQVLEFIVNP